MEKTKMWALSKDHLFVQYIVIKSNSVAIYSLVV